MSQEPVIRLERFLPQPPATVWRALTEPELQRRWWAAGDVRPVVGHRFTMDMGRWGEQACEVLEVEPERRLRYAFATGTLDTTITFDLAPAAGGTHLTFTHEGFDLDAPLGRTALEGMAQGWPRVLDKLAAALEEVGAR